MSKLIKAKIQDFLFEIAELLFTRKDIKFAVLLRFIKDQQKPKTKATICSCPVGKQFPVFSDTRPFRGH